MEAIQLLQSYQSDGLTNFFKIITFFGNWEFYLFGMPILYWLFNKEKIIKLYFIVFPSALIITYLKQIFHAPRPEGVALIEQSGYSFPSAHAAGATVLFLMAVILTKKKWMYWISAIMIILVSMSRIYLGVHFLKDVLGGIAIGGTLVCIYEFLIYDNVRSWVSNKSFEIKLIGLIIITGLIILLDKMNTYNMSIIFGLSVGLIFIENNNDVSIQKNFKKIATVVIGSITIYFLWAGIMKGILPMSYFWTFIIFALYGVFIIGLPRIFTLSEVN